MTQKSLRDESIPFAVNIKVNIIIQFHEIIFVFYWQKISDEWIFFRIVTVNGKILFIMASRLKFLRSQ